MESDYNKIVEGVTENFLNTFIPLKIHDIKQ